MIVRSTLRTAALAGVCLIPLAAAAQDDTGFDMPEAAPNTQALKDISSQPAEAYDNEATIGIRGQSGTNADYGRYNGWYQGGADVVGSLRMRHRDDWKSGGTYYMDFNAKDLAFGMGSFNLAPESSVDLRVGNQGLWGLTANYDAKTYVSSDNFTALYDASGNRTGGIGANASANTANVSAMQQFLVGTRRDKGTVTGKYSFGDLQFTSGVTHEHKEGTQEGFVDFLTSATFLMPINYDTDRVDAGVAYNTKKMQASLGYTFSKFTDNNAAIDFMNAKVSGGVTTSGAVFVLPPSNTAHQVNAQLGYNINDVTRLNINGNYGLQMQNDAFQLASINPAVAIGAPPRSSLDGFVQTVFGNVALSTRPLPKANLRASYTVDIREDNTPAEYGIQGLRADASNRLTVRDPLRPSWTKQKAELEAGYRILPSTRVSLGYTWRDEDRTNAVVKTTKENEESAKIHTTFSDDLSGTLGYTHSNRNASNPDFSVWQGLVNNGGDCGQSGTGNASIDCLQVPYYMASRTQDAVKARMTQTIGNDASVSFASGVASDRYPVTYGRTADYKVTAGPDLSYRFTPDAETHAFYTYERSFNTFQDNSVPNPSANPSKNWSASTTSDTHTLGLGGSLRPAQDIKLGADYLFSYGLIDVSQNGASGAASADQLPLTTSMLNSVKLHGEYEYVPGVTFYMGYGFDRLLSNDWALIGNYSGAFSSGQGNPSYAIHSVLSRVSFKW